MRCKSIQRRSSSPFTVNRYIAKLQHSLNHAIAISLKRNPLSAKSKFVRAIVLVKGVHFYGFHANYAPFLKVYIADPAFVNRAVTIMQSGTIMKTRFRVYESHIQYLLQFLCDFGLYGCGWIDLGDVWQRSPDDQVDGNEQDTELTETFSAFKISPHFRQSRMPLEVDSIAPHILNRYKLSARNWHHKLTIPAPPLPPEPLVLSVRELWEDERQRRIAKGLSPSPEIPKDLSANSRGSGAGWVAEARWWDEIHKRIERERGREVVPPRMSWEKWVMTTFESIEALWGDEHKTWRPQLEDAAVVGGDRRGPSTAEEQNPYGPSAMTAAAGGVGGTSDTNGEEEVDVDEAMLGSQAMSQIMEREEAEWQNEVQGHEELEPEVDDPLQEDEEALEDGPLPDWQSIDGDLEDGYAARRSCAATNSCYGSEKNPFVNSDEDGPPSPSPSPSKSANPFKAIWSKIAK